MVFTDFRKVLNLPNPTYMVALEKFNKFIVHHDSSLLSYSIDILARVALGHSQPQLLEATLEKIAEHDGHILFFRAGRIGNRTLSKHVFMTKTMFLFSDTAIPSYLCP